MIAPPHAVARHSPIGAEPCRGGAHVRVWAPRASRVAVVITGEAREVVLSREPGGEYHAGVVAGLHAGARYQLRLDDSQLLLADPASRFQPDGPFGPSELVDPLAFAWTDADWRGVAAHAHVLYELHAGTFTPEGTWRAAAAQLPFLAELGVTTLELMPVAQCDGAYSWGYDGVNLFSPAHAYGTPDELRGFVDRAHALGLAVILDVVYNHFGPSGNTAIAFGPYVHAERANLWGGAIDFGAAAVREYYCANATAWIADYHLDGLRFDATHAMHAMHDERTPHILAELCAAARAAAPSRELWLVAENEAQDARLVREHGCDALWNDDFHHSAYVAATGVRDGYVRDYRGTAPELAAAVRRGFLFQGQQFAARARPRGAPARDLAPWRLVCCLENHDQIADLGRGERLVELADPATLRALTALLLLAPATPMLFQGQETGSRRPWDFFCAHTGELAAAVRRGRAELLALSERLATPEFQAVIRDPAARATFDACVLDPSERDLARSGPIALHRDLIHLRRSELAIARAAQDATLFDAAAIDDRVLCVRYAAPDRLLVVNLGPTFAQPSLAEPLVAPPPGASWRVALSTEAPRYGGHGTPAPFTPERVAFPARSALWLVT